MVDASAMWMIEDTVTLPPGRWQFRVPFWMNMSRSINGGGRRMILQVDGNNTAWTDIQMTPFTEYTFLYHGGISPIVNVTEERAVPIKLGFLGYGSAGTTYGHLGGYSGTVTRIGDPT